MKLLKKRWFALLLAVIVCAASLLLAVRVSGDRMSRKIEALFYDGTNSAGSDNAVAIDGQLYWRSLALDGMLSICEHYPELDEAVEYARQARETFLEAVTIGDKYGADVLMERRGQSLIAMAEHADLSQRDREGMELYAGRFNGAHAVIEQNTYNEKVMEFYKKVLDVFPMSILRKLAGVKGPEFFAFKEF